MMVSKKRKIFFSFTTYFIIPLLTHRYHCQSRKAILNEILPQAFLEPILGNLIKYERDFQKNNKPTRVM